MVTSFFKRLAGSLKANPEELELSDDMIEVEGVEDNEMAALEEDAYSAGGELAVDVYDDGDALFVKTMTAGVRKEDLEIILSREQVAIRGSRYDDLSPSDEHYVYQELYWGNFNRTIDLPEEVDIDHAEASEEHGLLTLRLPKIDRHRETNLKVK